MAINQSTFEAFIKAYTVNPAYALPPSSQGRFDYLLNTYLSQLQDTKIFNLNNVSTTKRYNIPFCKLSYLPIQIWKSITKVEKVDIKTGGRTELVVGYGNTYLTETVNLFDIEYITSIDFGCLICNCECEVIEITGFYGLDLPSYVSDNLYLIIYNNLTGASLGDGCCSNIKTKSSGEGTVTYYDKTPSTYLLNQPEMLLTYPAMAVAILRLKKYFLKLY